MVSLVFWAIWSGTVQVIDWNEFFICIDWDLSGAKRDLLVQHVAHEIFLAMSARDVTNSTKHGESDTQIPKPPLYNMTPK